MTSSKQEIERIARGLSKAQRDGVLALTRRPADGTEIGVGHGLDMFMLIYRGVVTFRKRFFLFGEPVFYLTRLGKKVRAYLQEQVE